MGVARTAAGMGWRLGGVGEEAEAPDLPDEAVGELLPERRRRGWNGNGNGNGDDGGRWRCPVGQAGDVEVPGRGFEVPMIEVFLELADRAAILQEVYRMAVAKGDRQDGFLDAGPAGGFPDQRLDAAGT